MVCLQQVLKGHDDHVITCLQFSGTRIVSGSDDNTLKVSITARHRGRGSGLFINQVPKVYSNIFVGNFGDFIGWVIKLSVHTFQPLILICRRGNFFFFNIRDVHQFIGNCLIPLDPWIVAPIKTSTNILFFSHRLKNNKNDNIHVNTNLDQSKF